MVNNPVARFATIGSAFRYTFITIGNYFLPAYYLAAFPEFTNQFIFLSASGLAAAGVASTSLGGVIADRYSK